MTKQKIFEIRWKLEKWIIKTVAGIVTFAIVIFNDDIVDALEDVMDSVSEFIYDNTGMSSRTSETIVAVVTLYLLVCGINWFFKTAIPRILTMKRKSSETEAQAKES